MAKQDAIEEGGRNALYEIELGKLVKHVPKNGHGRDLTLLLVGLFNYTNIKASEIHLLFNK